MNARIRATLAGLAALVVTSAALVAAPPAEAAARPVVSAVSPNAGPTAGGIRVTIHGSGFKNVKSVRFGKAAASHIHVLSKKKLTVRAPKHVAGVVDVSVITKSGKSAARTADHFTYIAPPVITSVAPAASKPAGGITVTLRGRNFNHVKSVLFGSTKAATFGVVSSKQLFVTAPAHTAGRVDVRVVTAYGTSRAVTADHYSYVGPPTVSKLSPSSGAIAGGTPVTITGTNFVGVTGVTFGGLAGTGLHVTSPEALTVTTPAGPDAAVDVVVTTKYGTSATTAADHYTFLNIALTDQAGAALAQRLFGGGGTVTVPVQPDCASSVPIACPGGVPSNPPPNISIDMSVHNGDAARAIGGYNVSSKAFDITGRFRVKTLQSIPVTVPVAGDCTLDFDTTPGPTPDVEADFADAVDTTNAPDGPTVVGTINIPNFTSDDYTLGPSDSVACTAFGEGAITQVQSIFDSIITNWIDSIAALCGAPSPDYFQTCPAN